MLERGTCGIRVIRGKVQSTIAPLSWTRACLFAMSQYDPYCRFKRRSIMKVRLSGKVGDGVEMVIVDLAACPRVGETVNIYNAFHVGDDGKYPLGASERYPSFIVKSVTHFVAAECDVSLELEHTRV